MRKSEFSIKGLTATAVAVGAAFTLATGAFAAQTVVFAEQGTTAEITSKTVSAGAPFTFDVVYSAGANESGLGLKLRYDATKFSAINVVPGQTLTSCNIGGLAATADSVDGIQKQTGTFGAFNAQLVAGWIYSANDGGAVKWPNGGAPAGANDCLVNSGAATNALPVKLYRVSATPAAGFSGSTSLQLTADGNFSYAGASPGMSDKTLTLSAGAAPTCNLDVDGNGSVQAFVDGILVVRNMLNITGAGYTSGVTVPAGATRTTEAAVKAFIASNNYDIDGNGSQQAFVDGIVLVRLMLNVPNATLLNGVTVPAGATFTTAAAIRANVNSKCGTNF